MMVRHEANNVVIEVPDDVFRSIPDDSIKIISDLDVTDSSNNGTGSLNGCHVTLDIGARSSDDDSYNSKSESCVLDPAMRSDLSF